MSLEARPRITDFAPRVGRSFQVQVHAQPLAPDGAAAVEWKLDACRALPKPPLAELAEADCFELLFSCGSALPQGSFRLTAEDGFAITLFAVPVSGERMVVTVN